MIEWDAKKVVDAARLVLKNVSKKVAEYVMEDAKTILKSKAKTTTEKGLLDQFSVEKSRFQDGGFLVWCQGSKNWTPPYHASFVEMGTFKDIAKPYLRPARKKNIRKANRMYQKGMDKL